MQLKSTLVFQPRRATAKPADRRESIAGPRIFPSGEEHACTKYPDWLVRRVRTMHVAGLGPKRIHRQLTGEGIQITYSAVRNFAYGLRTER